MSGIQIPEKEITIPGSFIGRGLYPLLGLLMTAIESRADWQRIKLVFDTAPFSLTIKNNKSEATVQARWEGSGLSVRKAGESTSFYNANSDGETVRFDNLTIDQVAEQILSLATHQPTEFDSVSAPA